MRGENEHMPYHLDKTKSECNNHLQVLQETETSVSEIQFRPSTRFQFPDSLMPVSFENRKCINLK